MVGKKILILILRFTHIYSNLRWGKKLGLVHGVFTFQPQPKRNIGERERERERERESLIIG